MTVLSVLDAAGRRRSPATLPGYHAGRPPRNKGMRYPADPPTVEEIVAVMRHTTDDRHGWRVRAMIVVLVARRAARPGGARARRARPRPPARVDPGPPRQGRPPARGRDGRVGLGAAAAVADARASSCRSGRCSASSTARPAGDRGPAPRSAASSGASRPRRASGAGSRRTSCATRTRSSSRARACR